jgi:hypothetical protein
MKIILLAAILSSLLANIMAETTTIECTVRTIFGLLGCQFFYLTIEKDEAISIETDPEDADPSTILWVRFIESSIYTIPKEAFDKFPNTKILWAVQQNIQEIHPDTFENAKNLEEISLGYNKLTYLHKDTFKGNS